MKTKLTVTLMFLCICLFSTNAMAFDLPAECRQILDSKYSGWKMVKAIEGVTEYYKKEKITDAPNLVKGDWNGDGKEDYAALIEYGSEKVDDKMMPMVWTIAFIKSPKGYSHYKLEGGDYIQVVKKAKKILTPKQTRILSIKLTRFSPASGKNRELFMFGTKPNSNR